MRTLRPETKGPSCEYGFRRRVVASQLPGGTRAAAITGSNTRGPGSGSTRMTDPAMTPGTVPATSV